MTTTFCDSAAVKLKAGANVSTSLTDAQYTQLINQAENLINTLIKDEETDFVASYGSLNSNAKLILEDCASSYAAVGAINYDMSGFTTRQEALIMVNINWAKFQEGVQRLKDKKFSDFVKGA